MNSPCIALCQTSNRLTGTGCVFIGACCRGKTFLDYADNSRSPQWLLAVPIAGTTRKWEFRMVGGRLSIGLLPSPRKCRPAIVSCWKSGSTCFHAILTSKARRLWLRYNLGERDFDVDGGMSAWTATRFARSARPASSAAFSGRPNAR